MLLHQSENWLAEFLRNATLCCVARGQRIKELSKRLGKPDQQGRAASNISILKYGAVEFGFVEEQLMCIQINVLGEPVSLRLDGTNELSIGADLLSQAGFEKFMLSSKISWSCYGPLTFDEQCTLITSGGVQVGFLDGLLSDITTGWGGKKGDAAG